MSRIIIYPYKMGSKSAGRLAEALRERGHRVLKVFPDRLYRPRRSDVIVNWGNSVVPTWLIDASRIIYNTWLNSIWNVGETSNKLRAFQAMQEAGVSIPEFTTDGEYAHDQWASGEWGNGVLGRKILQGHSGAGIDILDDEHLFNIRDYPLYVKYIKKAAEYRVHVFRGQVIDIQQKRKKRNYDGEIDTKIRSHDRGWVFTREEINPPAAVLEESRKAVSSLGLDFGAVDVIWNNHYSTAYVLEVNTAPGLEGRTIESYANAIGGIVNV